MPKRSRKSVSTKAEKASTKRKKPATDPDHSPCRISSASSTEPVPSSKKSMKNDDPSFSLPKSAEIRLTPSKEDWNFKILSWNVAGLRAWVKKRGVSTVLEQRPDIVCLQETKCSSSELPPEITKLDATQTGLGCPEESTKYHMYWVESQTRGYAGVSLWSKTKPKNVTFGLGCADHDAEGRVIVAEFDQFYVISCYVPNSGRELHRLPYRQQWNKDLSTYIRALNQKKPVILAGDLNVAHRWIDLANPSTNQRSAGFSIEERNDFTELLSGNFLDSYRAFYPDTSSVYSYWSYMRNAREKNVGWRVDYIILSTSLVGQLRDCSMLSEALGSDHCPVELRMKV